MWYLCQGVSSSPCLGAQQRRPQAAALSMQSWGEQSDELLLNVACTLPLQKCPFDAIMIINLPKDLAKETTHRYGPNSFKLHR